MKFSKAQRVLGVALVAYVVADVLLTPPAHLETRDPALVTTVGNAALVLLFLGLALSIVALVLLFRRSARRIQGRPAWGTDTSTVSILPVCD